MKSKSKMFRFRKHSKIILSEIPEEWDICKLQCLSIPITKGTTPTTENESFVEVGIPFIKIEAIDKTGQIIEEKLSYISKKTHSKLKRSQIKEGDLLFSIAGTLGQICNVPKKYSPANTNQALSIIRLKKDDISKEFLLQYLQSFLTKRQILIEKTVLAQPNLSLEQVSNLQILKPRYSEQIKIVSILSNVDSIIFKNNEILKKTELLKKGLMQKLFHEGIGNNEFKKIDWYLRKKIKIPKTWDVKTGEKLFKLYGGKAPSKIKFSDDGEIQYVKVDDMNSQENQKIIKNSKLKFKKNDNERIPIFAKNSILFPKRGVAIFTNKVRMLENESNVDTNVMVLVCKDNTDPWFMYYYLLYIELFKLMENAGIPQLNNKDFYPRKFLCPEIDEQKKIASILFNIDNTILNLKSKSFSIDILKKGLMQKLLTGTTRVKV